MKTVKALRATLIPRPFRWHGKKSLAATIVIGLRKNSENQFRIIPEPKLMDELLPLLDADDILDFGMPKPYPEFLVSGNAYTCHQKDKCQCMVKVKVDDKEKSVLVFGDRYWNDGKITKPSEFERQPMNWENTFGGPEIADNPVGTGITAIQIGNRAAVKLPNVESLTDRIERPGQKVGPVNLGAIHIDWPHRILKAGTFNDEWLKREGSGFFDDMDQTMFNAAQDDQIWFDRTSLPLGAKFSIWNMHPSEPVWEGTIPELKARCFYVKRNEKTLSEITMRPTTAWFVPDQDSMIMMFHGVVAIDEDDAFDISHIMPAVERLEQPRTKIHYEEVLARRIDLEQGVFYALKDEELLPGDMLEPWFEQDSIERQHSMLDKLSSRRYTGYGTDGHTIEQFVGPRKPMTLNDLPEMAERARIMQEDMLADSIEKAEAGSKQLKELEKGEDAEFASQLSAELKQVMTGKVQDQNKPVIPTSGPPTLNNLQKGVPESLRKEIKREIAGVMKSANQNSQQPDFVSTSLRKYYLYNVQFQQDVVRLGAHKSTALRERVSKRMHNDGDLQKFNLTGADLSNMNLSGANLSHAWLEGADLTGCDLSGAILDETVLARANLSNANLSHAKITNSNLSEAQLSGTNFDHAFLEDVIIENKMTVGECSFEKATLNNLNVDAMDIRNCKFVDARFSMGSFEKLNIENSDFSGTKFFRTTFIECTFKKLLLDGAQLKNCMFTESQFSAVSFKRTALSRVTFFDHTIFSHCDWVESFMQQCSMRNSVISNSNLGAGTFKQCDFSLSTFTDCTMHAMKTPQSLFSRAIFRGCDLSAGNFMYGNLQKSIFERCVLDGSNFFRADLSETRIDPDTKMDRLYTDGARLAPFHDEVKSRWDWHLK